MGITDQNIEMSRIKVRNPFLRVWLRIPIARQFGWRYLWDEEFRIKIRKRRHNKRKRKLYGANWVTKRVSSISKLVQRDGDICQICFRKLKESEMTVDHITKLAEGPRNHSLENLRILCEPCHVEFHRSEQRQRKVIHR